MHCDGEAIIFTNGNRETYSMIFPFFVTVLFKLLAFALDGGIPKG